MRVGLTCALDQLPPVVRGLLAPVPPDQVADLVAPGAARGDATVPLEASALAGAYVLGRLALAGHLPATWPDAFRREAAAFATALPERIDALLVESRRRPFAAARLRHQAAARHARQATALLDAAAGLAGLGPTT